MDNTTDEKARPSRYSVSFRCFHWHLEILNLGTHALKHGGPWGWTMTKTVRASIVNMFQNISANQNWSCAVIPKTWHQLPVQDQTYATWQWHSPGTSNCDLQHPQLESHVTGDVFPTSDSDTKTEWLSWPLPQYLEEPDILSLLLSQALHMMDLRDRWHHQNTELLEWNGFG